MSSQVGKVETGILGLREDLKAIRAELTQVRSHVNALQKPLEQVRAPLLEVAGPLSSLEKRLNALQDLVAWVLVAIGLSAVAVALGTPLAAFLLHKHIGGFFRTRAHD